MKTFYIPTEMLIEIRNVNYLNVQRPQGYKVSLLEGRKQHSFIYTVTGEMRYCFHDPEIGDVVAPSGCLVFIPAGAKHTSEYTGEGNYINMIRFDLLADMLPKYLTAVSAIQTDAATEIFSKINCDIKSGIADNPLYFTHQIYSLLLNVAVNFEKIPQRYKKLRPAIKEMNEFFSVCHNVRYYSDLCGMSESAFRRLFKEYTGMSPVAYRHHVALHEAKNLLSSGEFYITEVAEAVGFSNLSFFYRSYKKMFGSSPGRDT